MKRMKQFRDPTSGMVASFLVVVVVYVVAVALIARAQDDRVVAGESIAVDDYFVVQPSCWASGPWLQIDPERDLLLIGGNACRDGELVEYEPLEFRLWEARGQ